MNNNQFNFIVFLRAVAAIMVMLSHLWLIFWYSDIVSKVFPYLDFSSPITGLKSINISPFLNQLHLNFGSIGVASFFIITGFLAGLSISNQSRLKYLFTRCFRIFPIYIVGFSVTFLIIFFYTKITNQVFPYDFYSWLIQISLFRDFFWIPSIDGVSWTLEAQIKFYLIIALLGLKKTQSAKALVILSCSLVLLSMLLNINHVQLEKYIYIFRFAEILKLSTFSISYMLIGLALYQYHNNIWSLSKTVLTITLLYICFVFACVSHSSVNALDFIVNYTIILIIFVILYFFSKNDNSNIFICKPISFIADISYPLYIIHGLNGYIIMTIFYKLQLVTPFQGLVVSIIIVFLLAYFLHIFIEKPMLKLKKNFFHTLK